MNIAQQNEISKLAGELESSDLLRERIEWLDSREKENPLIQFLVGYHPDAHTKEAMEYLGMHDCDFQELVEQVIWTIFTKRVSVEMAIEIIGSLNNFSEVA